MSLQSIGFFGFLLIVAAVYLHLPQRWQNPFLLAASWYFYAKAMPAMLPVTIAIAACTQLPQLRRADADPGSNFLHVPAVF